MSFGPRWDSISAMSKLLQGLQAWSLWRSFSREKLPLRYLFLNVNQRCNLRCLHCNYWKLDDRDRARYLTQARRQGILEEYAGMSPGATVVIAGGESLLEPDDYFHITTTCRRLGLSCISVVNGTCIRDADVAARMIREGPTAISVSLDSPVEAQHDELRGVPGAFRKATEAVRLLRQAREAQAASTQLYVMALVHEGNYRQLDSFYALALRDLGADKLKLNLIQPTFGGQGPDLFFQRYHIRDARALLSVIQACDGKYGLNLNPEWMAMVEMYVTSICRNPDPAHPWTRETCTRDQICNSCERNIMVDLYGNARLCFSDDFPSYQLLQPGDLRDFWFRHSAPIRRQMRRCKRYCGMSHCARRVSATRTPVAICSTHT